MKALLYTTSLLLVFLLPSCDKGLLQKAPYGQVSGESFFKTETDARMAVNAIYDVLQGFTVYNSFQMHADIWSDDAEKGGGGPADTKELEELNSFDILTSNWLIGSIWNSCWVGIYRANTSLERIPSITMPDAVKNQFLGEALFLRALLYYRLVERFNGVPLISSSDPNTSKSASRASAADSWKFIETDLLEAIGKLPASYTGNDVGRATKGSAQALLGRVYLFTRQWQKAADVYASVINSNTYRLMDDFAANFTNTTSDNLPESLFEVQFVSGTGNSGDANGRHGWTRPRGVPGISWGGNGFALPTQSLVNAFEPNDKRRPATVMVEGDNVFGDTYHSSWSLTGYNAMKYVFGPGVIHTESDVNYKIIRYSEVLLGYAEAVFNGANGTAGITGLQALNRVRNRAGLPDIGALSFNAIVQERRVEFALEGIRFFDLVRWGIAKDVLGPGFNVNKDEYMPLPISEITMNPNLQQNPGY